MFDVACTLVDVMTYVQPEQYSFEVGPREYLNDFIGIMSRLRGGQDRYLPMLLQKANESLPIATAAPSLALPLPTTGFVTEAIDLDESVTSTSDDTEFMNSPDLLASDTDINGFMIESSFPAFTAAGTWDAAPSNTLYAPTSNPYG